MCRAKIGRKAGLKEEIEQLRGWVKKGKAWAMGMLAQRYKDGVGVKQSDKKAIGLMLWITLLDLKDKKSVINMTRVMPFTLS